VVKEESYFAPNEGRAGCVPCRGAGLTGQGRSPERQGTANNRPRVRLFSRVPRRSCPNSGQCRL